MNWDNYMALYDMFVLRFLPYTTHIKKIVDIVIDQVSTKGTQKNYKVLEIGCGTGNILQEFEKHCTYPLLLTGVDNSEKALDIAREKVQNVELIEVDIHNLTKKVNLNTYDIIIINNVLYSLSPHENEALMLQLRKNLKNGCLLLISEPVEISPGHTAYIKFIKDFGIFSLISFYGFAIMNIFNFIVFCQVNQKYLMKTYDYSIVDRFFKNTLSLEKEYMGDNRISIYINDV